MLIYILTIDCLFNILSSHHGDFQCSLSLSFVQKDQKKLAHTWHCVARKILKFSLCVCRFFPLRVLLLMAYFLGNKHELFWKLKLEFDCVLVVIECVEKEQQSD